MTAIFTRDGDRSSRGDRRDDARARRDARRCPVGIQHDPALTDDTHAGRRQGRERRYSPGTRRRLVWQTRAVTSLASSRSYAPLSDAHLARLSELADEDHRHFTRPDGHPEYRDRRVSVALAQGGALHLLDGTTGIKDFDVWTFYAAIPDVRFPFGQRKRHLDFGPSEHGRNLYPPDFKHPQLKRWLNFSGRKVDMMVRILPVASSASQEAVTHAIRAWLHQGAREPRRPSDGDMPSNWWLAQKALVVIDPLPNRNLIVWPTA